MLNPEDPSAEIPNCARGFWKVVSFLALFGQLPHRRLDCPRGLRHAKSCTDLEHRLIRCGAPVIPVAADWQKPATDSKLQICREAVPEADGASSSAPLTPEARYARPNQTPEAQPAPDAQRQRQIHVCCQSYRGSLRLQASRLANRVRALPPQRERGNFDDASAAVGASRSPARLHRANESGVGNYVIPLGRAVYRPAGCPPRASRARGTRIPVQLPTARTRSKRGAQSTCAGRDP